jgi:hypothetical protein
MLILLWHHKCFSVLQFYLPLLSIVFVALQFPLIEIELIFLEYFENSAVRLRFNIRHLNS